MVQSPNSPPAIGLSSKKAEQLLKVFGKNELVATSELARFKQFLKILSDPMGLMMLALSILYFLTGNSTDAIIILIAYIPVTAVDVFLELKSEKALKALKSNVQTTVKVLRDQIIREIPIQFIVPGDVIVFEEGQSLPADGKVIECHNLAINESALTGESLPIEKELNSDFFAGTHILNGRGFGVIENTGKKTKFGQIGNLLEKTDAELSPLQAKVHVLVKKILFVAAFLVILLFLIEYFRNDEIIKSLITSLTFGMAAIPEEFPLVFTLYLSMGAYRLSKHGVLVKTLPSVESLGNVDVICTDKTGTLTEGRFTLVDLVPFGDIDNNHRNLISILACEPTPVDAMETAILEKQKEAQKSKSNWTLKFDYPFETHGKHMTHIWESQSGNSLLAMKGAVEGVLEHCADDQVTKDQIHAAVAKLASEGKRILGLATKNGPFTGDRLHDEKASHFIGLLVFSDPVRESAKKAIAECQNAGIEIKMLTGDHLLTAHAIADELDIKHTDRSIFSGSQLSTMSTGDRIQAFLNGSIFARVTPEQKYEMVKTLKDHNKVVAMTGDGVNDSPALKLADIGVNMGHNATDVARSTAKMILLKNDFNGIVQAVFEGRKIFTNLRRSFSYLVAFHIPVVLLAFIPPILGWPQLLLPVHIILLELIVHPISAFAFENLNSTETSQSKTLIPTPTAITAVISGVLLSAVSLIPILFLENDFLRLRSFAISIVLFGNIGFTLVESWPHFRNMKVVTIVILLTLLPMIFNHFSVFNELLYLKPLSFMEIGISLALGILASLPTFIFRVRPFRQK